MADINVTPLVDVMLVLLIIFMITAPLLVTGVPVDLPDARASALNDEDNKPVQISVNETGAIFIDEMEITLDELAPKLAAIAEARRDDPRIYVRADSTLDYGAVMKVVGEVNGAGFKKVALITEQKGS
ncbi:MAG TPA: protein TolR [Pedomonas sp.]|nr:protein TolR [Pedomonas sp.]